MRTRSGLCKAREVVVMKRDLREITIERQVMGSDFGATLERLLKERRITQKELSKAIGVSPKSLSEWVGKGGRIPRSPNQLKALANFFGVSVHYLLFGEDDPQTIVENIFEKTDIHTGLYQITIKKVVPRTPNKKDERGSK